MRALVLIGMLTVPWMASAAMTEGRDWRNCTDDSECVLIEGTCSQTSVNKAFRSDAETFYRQEQAKANCVARFWEAKEKIAQCKPLSGSKPSVDAEVVPHNVCAAVAKTTGSKK